MSEETVRLTQVGSGSRTGPAELSSVCQSPLSEGVNMPALTNISLQYTHTVCVSAGLCDLNMGRLRDTKQAEAE